MPEVSMVSALNQALRRCLDEDPRLLVFGEDVGRLGGVFRVTDRLQQEFGETRVFDTPLAESAIVGISVGLALAGWHPVPEIQFNAFAYPALNQIISHVAKYRSRCAGTAELPLVIRMPTGGGIGAAEHHSESSESLFIHTAGLKVVVPSTPQDAFCLLVHSIRDPDPVVFLEPTSRYWAKAAGELTVAGLPLGVARVRREGHHCTLLAWGAMVARCLDAAEAAEEDGVELEVIDLRTLVPLDLETVVASVRKTGRAVVVHEAPLTLGFGAEIAARLTEEAFEYLHAPVLRVTGYDVPYPPALFEDFYRPGVRRILVAVDRALKG
jgi:2-oxoisovalerate dehydrogenase E1 component beta subunit